jgi:hypothetical protein
MYWEVSKQQYSIKERNATLTKETSQELNCWLNMRAIKL